jgi:acetyl esterase/lipase
MEPGFTLTTGLIFLVLGLMVMEPLSPMTSARTEPVGPQDPVERPADIWGYLRDAAAREGARPDRFLTYIGIGGRSHRIEIFQPGAAPSGRTSGYPGVVLFHGGAWREGAPVQFYRQARAIADAGFVVFLPEYALRDEDGATPRDSVADAFFAWEAIRSAEDDLAVAPDRLFAGGASAGGHLAAALATLAPPDSIKDHVRPAGLILFEPVVDNGPGGYGHGLVRDDWESFSPIHNVGIDHPDTLILVGDSDALIPVETAELYCQRVRVAHGNCALEVFKDAGHAWFNYDPAGFSGTLSAALSTLEAWGQSRED